MLRLVPLVLAALATELPELSAGDLATWRAHVRPVPTALAFQEIEWIDDFAVGVRASEKQQKPLLFWAMNGHPLGCT